MKILVLISEVSNRLSYIFDTILRERMYVGYEFTTSEEQYLKYDGPRFVYRETSLEGELFFCAVPLLWQTEIINYEPKFVDDDFVGGLFPVNGGEMRFDLFATAFYLISRYEEYLPHSQDKHGRFRASDSVAKKNRFLKEPMVEHYATRLMVLLKARFPDIQVTPIVPKLEVTIDIDNLFAYRYKGLVRTMGSVIKKFLVFKWGAAIQHIFVLLGVAQDPYDSYEKMNAIHNKYGLRPIYFYLVGSKGAYDRNLEITSPLVKSTLGKLKHQAEIALHPSYESNKDIEVLKKEKRLLEECVGEEVTKSRQHFIKLNVPQTYRSLISIGIKDDYSMGYATRVGFRASTSKPFSFFDIEKNEKQPLVIHPFFIMDTTLLKYMRLSGKRAMSYAKKNLSKLVSVNNVDIVYLFHNESIHGKGVWRGWEQVYDEMIKYVVQSDKK